MIIRWLKRVLIAVAVLVLVSAAGFASWRHFEIAETARNRPQIDPEHFSVYVAIGVVAGVVENETAGYQGTLAIARERGDEEAIAALEAIAPYPEADGLTPDEKIGVLRDYETRFGVGMSRRYADDNIMMVMLGFALRSPEYGLRDIGYFLAQPQWPELEAWVDFFDARKYGLDFEMPVVFILGRHDWQTPSTVAERMFEEIEAPEKQLFWLEESAHAPNVDEPERFAEIIEQVVAPLARRPLEEAAPRNPTSGRASQSP